MEKLDLKIPRTVGGLIRRGARAKLRCSIDCRASVKLVAKGARARQMDVAGTIGRSKADLEANTAAWVRTKLSRRYARRVAASGATSPPRIVALISARPQR